MAAHPLTHAVVRLQEDRPVFRPFDNRGGFKEECRFLTEHNLPYATFERRMRKGRWLWHPTETRFFDPSPPASIKGKWEAHIEELTSVKK